MLNTLDFSKDDCGVSLINDRIGTNAKEEDQKIQKLAVTTDTELPTAPKTITTPTPEQAKAKSITVTGFKDANPIVTSGVLPTGGPNITQPAAPAQPTNIPTASLSPKTTPPRYFGVRSDDNDDLTPADQDLDYPQTGVKPHKP